MNLEQPDARALLDIAHETLLEQLLPLLDGDARYQALMIANAMAMAMRELTPTATNPSDKPAPAAQLLASLYGQDDEASIASRTEATRATRATPARWERRFARDLRDGELSEDRQAVVRQLLRVDIESRLAVSNPRRLARESAGAFGGLGTKAPAD
jgi:hypothetical protein